MKQLATASAIFGLFGIPLLLAIVNRNICFTDNAISYRPFIFFQAKNYSFEQIRSVETACDKSKSGWGIGMDINLKDGMRLTVNDDDLWQQEPFVRIIKLLHRAPFDNTRVASECPAEKRLMLNSA